MPEVPEEEQTPLVNALLGFLEQYSAHIVSLEETVAGLKDEINVLKGETVKAELPTELGGRYFSPELTRFVLYQYHHCRSTQPLLEQLREYGIDISAGQIESSLSQGHEHLHAEKDALMQAGLGSSSFVTVDYSCARHRGKNDYVTYIGYECFAWFKSMASKGRLNFLDSLRAGHKDFSS